MKNFGIDYSMFFYEQKGKSAICLYGKDLNNLTYEEAKTYFEEFNGNEVNVDDKSYIPDLPVVILSAMIFRTENFEFIPLEEKIKIIVNLRDYIPL